MLIDLTLHDDEDYIYKLIDTRLMLIDRDGEPKCEKFVVEPKCKKLADG